MGARCEGACSPGVRAVQGASLSSRAPAGRLSSSTPQPRLPLFARRPFHSTASLWPTRGRLGMASIWRLWGTTTRFQVIWARCAGLFCWHCHVLDLQTLRPSITATIRLHCRSRWQQAPGPQPRSDQVLALGGRAAVQHGEPSSGPGRRHPAACLWLAQGRCEEPGQATEQADVSARPACNLVPWHGGANEGGAPPLACSSKFPWRWAPRSLCLHGLSFPLL